MSTHDYTKNAFSSFFLGGDWKQFKGKIHSTICTSHGYVHKSRNDQTISVNYDSNKVTKFNKWCKASKPITISMTRNSWNCYTDIHREATTEKMWLNLIKMSRFCHTHLHFSYAHHFFPSSPRLFLILFRVDNYAQRLYGWKIFIFISCQLSKLSQ